MQAHVQISFHLSFFFLYYMLEILVFFVANKISRYALV